MKGKHERQARRSNRQVRASRTGQTNRRAKQSQKGRQVWKGLAVPGRHRANFKSSKSKEKKWNEKSTFFGVNLTKNLVVYQAAQRTS